MPLHYLVYTLAILIYALFAWFGKAPAEGFIIVLTGVISHAGAANLSERSAKNATDAANHANPVPPPPPQVLPTFTTQEK